MAFLRVFSSFLIICILYSCSSTTALILDDPAFINDMVQSALEGEQFHITEEDYAGIRQLLADSDFQRRRAGLILAGQTKDKSIYPDIIAGVNDTNEEVSQTAYDVIIADSEDFRLFLTERLVDSNALTRASILKILGRIGGEDLVPVIIGYFEDPDTQVRSQASLAVSRLADRNNPFLRNALSSSNTLRAAMAYRTLGRYSNPDDLPLMIAAFISEKSEIRKEAQLAALRIREAGLPLLHDEAKNSKRPMESRLTALNVIQGLRSPTSLSTLVRLLEDPLEKIRTKSNHRSHVLRIVVVVSNFACCDKDDAHM